MGEKLDKSKTERLVIFMPRISPENLEMHL